MSDMKKLLESMDALQECPPMEGPGMAPMDQGTPVSINVSMNASGKDHVADLIDMMKNAGLGDAKPAADAMMPMRTDMERLRNIVDSPKVGDAELDIDLDGDYQPNIALQPKEENIQEDAVDPNEVEELLKRFNSNAREYNAYGNPDTKAVVAALQQGDIEAAMEEIYYTDPDGGEPRGGFDNLLQDLEDDFMDLAGIDEGYDNEPDEEYHDHEKMTRDLSGGINREKKAYAAAQDGDNAMAVEAIKAQLMAALEEKKAKPDYLDMDGDGDKEEPMKKAIKDKKAKK